MKSSVRSDKMKKKDADAGKITLVFEVDPTECPFREFKDNELALEYWGLGPAACRAAIVLSGKAPKPPIDFVWADDQTQPLPRSVRQYLHGWIRAEDLATDRWEAEVVVEDSNGSNMMSIIDMQLSHAQVLMRSSFCRKVLSACFMLERVEGLAPEHQWDNFVFSYAPEGWRARYHIYSPGTKPGGGPQHRPGLSKNGCYLVRLFYLGAWRCVWVNDQIPVDATDAPLLPFSPLLSHPPPIKGMRTVPATVTSNEVHLWPLLICKALLKLAAPDMNSDENSDSMEDELMPDLDILHALTGCMSLTYDITDKEGLWKLLTSEIPVFSWDDDDETSPSTIKSKPKKLTTKETITRQHRSMATLLLEDSKDCPPYWLPGITPAHEQDLLVTMARDVPLKKPLPEPEVALWKYYRWVDWARRHGLYESYDCPRTKFLKVNGLMKLSYAPHLLDVMSTESITFGFREEHDKTPPKKGKGENNRSQTAGGVNKQITSTQATQMREELREWIQYDPLQGLVKRTSIVFFPSMFNFTTAASTPPIRITKSINRALDIPAPKCGPLYLQIDGPDMNYLRLSLESLHPRIMINSGIPLDDYVETAYLFLEKFEWFVDCEVPEATAYVKTRGYDSVEVAFQAGRHCCRLWVHSRMNWYVSLLSDSTLLLGTRDMVQSAAVRECPWASRFLSSLAAAFTIWIRMDRSNPTILTMDRDFYKSYQPDLIWDPETVGYNQVLIHWMFRQALQSLLKKRLLEVDYPIVCNVLRHYFSDPDFGLPPRPALPKSLREMVAMDPCDCVLPEVEQMEVAEECLEEETTSVDEKPVVGSDLMTQLLTEPVPPIASQVCELATEELPCGLLKDEREKMIKKHEAATVIQAHWRGFWARKCLHHRILFTTDVMKHVMDNAFGNLEALSALMNEFFGMYPGAKAAYSVASALSGINGLFQHHGSSSATHRCRWIPYFQAVFYCHAPVKVHFTVQSPVQYSTVMVYNNDTGLQMPQAFNAHITFNFSPNSYGYTVMGHGTLKESTGHNHEVHWQLTVLSSIDGAFHVCDNDPEGCKDVAIQGAYKLHIDDIFLPNRRNILGGILISVSKHEAISFRAASTSPELEIVATLRSISTLGEIEELAHCSGKGEVFWPYIRLQPYPPGEMSLAAKKRSVSHANVPVFNDNGQNNRNLVTKSARTVKQVTPKNRSTTKMKPITIEPKQYSIEVTAPTGWPLSLAQWKRVVEVRNCLEIPKAEAAKKLIKPSSAREKSHTQTVVLPPQVTYIPQPDDAYLELECSLAVGGGTLAKRDDLRDVEFAAARKEWNAKDPGRNQRGAQIRSEFRSEFLVALPPPPSESAMTMEEVYSDEFEMEGETKNNISMPLPQGPTPATESGLLEMETEPEEEVKYLFMPEQLKDKFIPLYFLPFCMKDRSEDETALVSDDMAEAAKQSRHARIEAALERMKELQGFNENFVLKRQRQRCQLLEPLLVDSQWCHDLVEVLEQRDEVIVRETLNRSQSATKKKQELKINKK